ncbi:AfsR/SARP family transcriptional regulator [Catellatospora citrea]|uniref:SARP family transcriptional regulator n=1 Tax=Catellatospora citrea TaxID=53366 RepID=A0A8J3KML3_9ACTN|nr:AfsR/SARP family transcriptional regulator [Catellatospora citrea]RKE10608.1 DNA-binding SARP family transcriptional activator [Catellatospora citrea]GIG02893.1 SARP family transcriptional regulator [Catellatospora citrea]
MTPAVQRSPTSAELDTDGTVRLQIMGPLRVWRGRVELDTGPRQQRRLLALLTARVGQTISMADLVDSLWGDDCPPSAINVIHKYIGALRRVLEPALPARTSGSYLVRSGSGYRFTAGPQTLDLVAFRQHVTEAEANVRQNQPREALASYVEALRLCQGKAGDGLADSATVNAVFAGLNGEFFDAVVDAADIAVPLGEPARVLSSLRLAAEMDPFHELVHACLVTALAAAGQQAEALTVFQTVRQRLAEDLGIDPGHALQEAQRRVLTQTAARPAPNPTAAAAPLVAGAPLVRPAQLPPDLSWFVGRSAELALLQGLVAGMHDGERGGPLVVAVDGMGGVGKSTLAVHFARQVADRFPDGQLYLDLQGDQNDGTVHAADALRSLLFALGAPAAHLPDTFDALVGKYRSMTAGKRFLVLLDNVRDSAQVRPLLPNCADSLVLLTSRRPLLGLAAFDGAHLFRLAVPNLHTARQLLERRLPTSAGDTALADEIIELCGRLPLALAVLGARLTARPALSLAAVAADLRDGARRLEAFPGDAGTRDPRTAFSWSYHQLSPGAARMFRLLSVSLTAGITVAACVSLSGLDPMRTRAELDELTEAALITEQEEGRFSSHVLVKSYAGELFGEIDPPHEQRAAITRLLEHYLHSGFNAQTVYTPHRLSIPPPPPQPGVTPEQPATFEQAGAWFSAHHEVLVEAVRLAADVDHGVAPWRFALIMQHYLQWAGYFQDWEDVTRWAVRAARATGDEIGQGHALRSLAGARWSLRANDEALRLLHAAQEIFHKHGMLLEQAVTHVNMHWVHEALGQDEQALAHGRQALDLYRGLDHRRGVSFSLMSSGRSLSRLGRLDESAELLNQVLEIVDQLRSEPNADTDIQRIALEAETRMAVAANLIRQGRAADAAAQLELSARLSDQVNQRTNQFEALRQLAEVRASTGDTAGAVEALDSARMVLDRFPDGGPDHLRARFVRLAEELSEITADTQGDDPPKSPNDPGTATDELRPRR